MKRIGQKRKGFTIIEVVLVLAIAGLIFLMVFVALPSLQRSQKDTQRKQDVDRVAAALIQYQANNQGNLPNPMTAFDGNFPESGCATIGGGSATPRILACEFVKNYLNSPDATVNEFKDPDGTPYSLRGSSTNPSADNLASFNHTIYIKYSAKCGGDSYFTSTSNSNDFVVLYHLEGSGVYCADNS